MSIRDSLKWCESHGLNEDVFKEYRDYLEEASQETVYRKELKLTWWDK